MPELAFETGKSSFTEEQMQKIQQEAMAEIRGEKKPEEKKEPEDKKEEPQDKKEPEQSEQLEKKVEETEQADIDNKEENKAEVKKEEKPAPKDDAQEKRQALIKKVSEEDKISLEQAAEEVAKNEAVIKKYFDDPIKLAAALRKAQSDSDKARAEVEKIKQQAQTPKLNDFASVRSHVDKTISQQRDKLVELYRAEYPGLSANLDDDAVVDLMRKEATEKMMVRVEENRLNQSRAANDKRQKVLNSLSQEDKEFLSDAKRIVDDTPDDFVLRNDYDVEDVLRYIRGDKARIQKIEKDAFERGLKQGREEPKIIAEKVPVKSDGNKKAVETKTVWANRLTADQRTSAENKFDGQQMSKEEMYKFYYETYVKR